MPSYYNVHAVSIEDDGRGGAIVRCWDGDEGLLYEARARQVRDYRGGSPFNECERSFESIE